MAAGNAWLKKSSNKQANSRVMIEGSENAREKRCEGPQAQISDIYGGDANAAAAAAAAAAADAHRQHHQFADVFSFLPQSAITNCGNGQSSCAVD